MAEKHTFVTPGILVSPPEDPELLEAVEKMAEYVASGGDSVEHAAKQVHKDDPLYRWVNALTVGVIL